MDSLQIAEVRLFREKVKAFTFVLQVEKDQKFSGVHALGCKVDKSSYRFPSLSTAED